MATLELLLAEASLGPAFPVLQPSFGASNTTFSLLPTLVFYTAVSLKLVFCWGSVYMGGGVRSQRSVLQTVITVAINSKSCGNCPDTHRVAAARGPGTIFLVFVFHFP